MSFHEIFRPKTVDRDHLSTMALRFKAVEAIPAADIQYALLAKIFRQF